MNKEELNAVVEILKELKNKATKEYENAKKKEHSNSSFYYGEVKEHLEGAIEAVEIFKEKNAF